MLCKGVMFWCKTNSRQSTLYCVYGFYGTVTNLCKVKFCKEINPMSYSCWKEINLPLTTLLFPFSDEWFILLFSSLSPGLHDEWGGWFRETSVFKRFPDKCQIRSVSFCCNGCTRSECWSRNRVCSLLGSTRGSWTNSRITCSRGRGNWGLKCLFLHRVSKRTGN